MLVLLILSVVTAVTVPRAASFLNAIAVRGAGDDVEALLGAARHLAIARATCASVEIDPVAGTLVLHAGSDTVRRWDERALHGVQLWSNRRTVTYSPIGLGTGGSDLTMTITRGEAADTIYVSRLGRVRRASE